MFIILYISMGICRRWRHMQCSHTALLCMFNSCHAMGLLPDKQYCGCACAGNAGNAFPVTTGKRSRHASRHVRHARAVMHVGIANLRFPLKSAAGENVPGIPGACATCNYTYLVRGPWKIIWIICVCFPSKPYVIRDFDKATHSSTQIWRC